MFRWSNELHAAEWRSGRHMHHQQSTHTKWKRINLKFILIFARFAKRKSNNININKGNKNTVTTMQDGARTTSWKRVDGESRWTRNKNSILSVLDVFCFSSRSAYSCEPLTTLSPFFLLRSRFLFVHIVAGSLFAWIIDAFMCVRCVLGASLVVPSPDELHHKNMVETWAQAKALAINSARHYYAFRFRSQLHALHSMHSRFGRCRLP